MNVVAAGAVDGRVGVHAGGGEDGQVRSGVRHVAGGRAQQQALGEQGVPGLFGDDADAQPMARIGTGPAIENEQIAALQVRADAIVEAVKGSGFEGAIDRSPPDLLAIRRIGDEEAITRRTAGAGPRVGDQRPQSERRPSPRRQRQLGQFRCRQVVADAAEVDQAVPAQVDHRRAPTSPLPFAGAGAAAPAGREGTAVGRSLRMARTPAGLDFVSGVRHSKHQTPNTKHELAAA